VAWGGGPGDRVRRERKALGVAAARAGLGLAAPTNLE